MTLPNLLRSFGSRGRESRPPIAPNRKIAFMHIAKTAGTAINKYFEDNLGEERCVCHLEGQRGLLQEKGAEGLRSYDFVSGHLRYFQFTTRLDPDEWCIFTCLRDPVPHVVSHLLWLKYIGSEENEAFRQTHDEAIQSLALDLNRTSLDDTRALEQIIYQRHPQAIQLFDNCQTRYFLREIRAPLSDSDFERAIKNSNLFRYICLSEQLGQHLKLITRKLGMQPRRPLKRVNENKMAERPDFSRPNVRQFYERLVDRDIQFYQTIKQTRTRNHWPFNRLIENQDTQDRDR